MKIHSIYLRVNQFVQRRIAGGGLAILGVALCAGASGQEFAASEFNPASTTVMSAPGGGQIVHGGSSFQIVDPSQVPTVANSRGKSVPSLPASFDIHAFDQGLAGGCTSCGTSDCDGGCSGSAYGYGYGACSSCGGNCGGTCGGGGYGGGGSMACPTCEPFSYMMVEGMYMQRDGNEGITFARDFQLDDFDFEWAPRITYGRVPDCVNGWEVGFTGLFEWDMFASATSATDSLQTLLRPVGNVQPVDLNTFGNARDQVQTYDAEMFSIELNRTRNGWEMAKFLYGVRYIDYREKYNYVSVDSTDGVGQLFSNTKNVLIGGQIGLDLVYPVAKIATVDLRSRGALFANIADSDLALINAGTGVFGGSDDQVDLAGLIEVGTGLRVQLGEILTVRAGAEFWYLSGIASAVNQFGVPISRVRGGINADDDFLIIGATAGAELRF